MEKDNINVTEAREIIAKQRVNVMKATPQSFVFCIAFGLAWIIGYSALALTNFSKLGYITFIGSLTLSMIITMVYLNTKVRGFKTADSKHYKWWGISWWLGFIIHFSIMGVFAKISPNIQGHESISQISWSLGNTIPLMIVSLGLLSGASLFKERLIGILGLIIGMIAIFTSHLLPVTGAIVCAGGGIVMLIFAGLDFYKSKKIGG